MQGTRTFTIIMSVGISIALLLLSIVGALGPAEGIARVPMTFLEDRFGGISNDASTFAEDLAEVRTLRERNQQLEESLSSFQSEVAELRAFRSDYDRLAEIANYVGQVGLEWRYVTGDVIGRDLNGIVRTIHTNAGTRDGVSIGDPVVTPVGLVGRVTKVTATGSEVLLVTDSNSSVNARILNDARDQGLLRGSLSGELILDFLDINAQVVENQQVYTTGETQNFPPNILLGQISGVRISSDELFQQATVDSLVDFDNLQLVLVITNWEPVDLQVFEEPVEETP